MRSHFLRFPQLAFLVLNGSCRYFFCVGQNLLGFVFRHRSQSSKTPQEGTSFSTANSPTLNFQASRSRPKNAFGFAPTLFCAFSSYLRSCFSQIDRVHCKGSRLSCSEPGTVEAPYFLAFAFELRLAFFATAVFLAVVFFFATFF